MQANHQLLRALPVDLIEIEDSVILKRGCAEFRVKGTGAVEVMRAIIETASGSGSTREAIAEGFARPDRDAIIKLIQELEARRFLVPVDEQWPSREPESNLGVFYWNFGAMEKAVASRLHAQRFAIFGVNQISHQLVASLRASGCSNMEVIDHPMLRNLRMFNEAGELRQGAWWDCATAVPQAFEAWEKQFLPESRNCIIATSDFGGFTTMREWNRFCVQRNIHFVPIVLQDLVGYVGPIVVPGETPCFECLRARQNANLQDPATQRAAEPFAFDTQNVVGFHPAMASILGDIAAIEIGKFYGGWMSSEAVGNVIVVRLLVPSVTTHRVLRIPRCSVCSSLNKRASTIIEKGIYPPGNPPNA